MKSSSRRAPWLVGSSLVASLLRHAHELALPNDLTSGSKLKPALEHMLITLGDCRDGALASTGCFTSE
ncbi:uncharacterized protein PHALS_02120 [Plasmopara halstedii]|uniref:Uncharacterized protein n=1 Tax=Plasmopara halstedii TaxID=4781 RepID=A0A0P1AX33_PLAHL|nr:uncharacterized protein PHALS_02120 [Plasmopara halstedii]CEG45847.1 hypothetical protein PHALS_02120 [Plasmopara halstedii]|eukprot:XP_024582216.1 hypothetical protein PHALS_02120 [Plasmopara halstedii]